MKRIQAMMPRRNGTRNLGGGHKTNAVPSRMSRDESGAVLILALIFLLVIGLIVGGLASWTANNLKNSLNFQQARSAQYALSSATQVAISNIRYTPLLNSNQTLNASPPSYCWGTSAPSEMTIQSGQSGQSNQSNQVARLVQHGMEPVQRFDPCRDDFGLPHERGPGHQPRPVRGKSGTPDGRGLRRLLVQWSATRCRYDHQQLQRWRWQHPHRHIALPCTGSGYGRHHRDRERNWVRQRRLQ